MRQTDRDRERRGWREREWKPGLGRSVSISPPSSVFSESNTSSQKCRWLIDALSFTQKLVEFRKYLPRTLLHTWDCAKYTWGYKRSHFCVVGNYNVFQWQRHTCMVWISTTSELYCSCTKVAKHSVPQIWQHPLLPGLDRATPSAYSAILEHPMERLRSPQSCTSCLLPSSLLFHTGISTSFCCGGSFCLWPGIFIGLAYLSMSYSPV